MHHAVGGILKHLATLFALLGILSCATLAQKSAPKPKFVTHHVKTRVIDYPSGKISYKWDTYSQWECPKGWMVDDEYPRFTCVAYVPDDGSGVVTGGTQSFSIASGDIYVASCPERHDYYGKHPIKPPFCIASGDVYMPSCPENGGHLMIWYKGKWTRYWSDEAEAKLSKGTRP